MKVIVGLLAVVGTIVILALVSRGRRPPGRGGEFFFFGPAILVVLMASSAAADEYHLIITTRGNNTNYVSRRIVVAEKQGQAYTIDTAGNLHFRPSQRDSAFRGAHHRVCLAAGYWMSVDSYRCLPGGLIPAPIGKKKGDSIRPAPIGDRIPIRQPSSKPTNFSVEGNLSGSNPAAVKKDGK